MKQIKMQADQKESEVRIRIGDYTDDDGRTIYLKPEQAERLAEQLYACSEAARAFDMTDDEEIYGRGF